MAVRYSKENQTQVAQPHVFKPTLNTLPSVTESGWYDFTVISAKEGKVLVLYGTPSRTDEAGNTEIFRNLPVCVSTEYFCDEVSPVERLFDALGIDVSQGVQLNSLKDINVQVYIDVTLRTKSGDTFWNGLDFEA